MQGSGNQREPRITTSQVLGAVMDGGPQTFEQLLERLYPSGKLSRVSKGWAAPSRDPLRRKLTDLGGLLVVADDRYAVAPRTKPTWVVYVGSEHVYAGIYDASLAPLLLQGGQEALSVVDHGGLDDTTLRDTLRDGFVALAKLAVGVPGEPGALVVGLPAALGLTNERVVGEAPERWTRNNTPTIEEIVREVWRVCQRRQPALPGLPVSEGGQLRLIADTDVVFDALGAMHDPRQLEPKPNDPRLARVLLALKHSSRIRSTVVTRGPDDLMLRPRRNRHDPAAPIRREPGVRRDGVWRGAYGDTIGLGHSNALIYTARQENSSEVDGDPEWRDVVQYHEQRVATKRPCHCGALRAAHLTSVAGFDEILERLQDMAGVGDGDEWIWGGVDELIERDGPEGRRAQAVLQESGRLVAAAVDSGVRLYDPDAVLVTGRVPFSEVFWRALWEASNVGQHSDRRSLRRAMDLPHDDISRPIGPRGAAWLGFDTWIFPELLRQVDSTRHND